MEAKRLSIEILTEKTVILFQWKFDIDFDFDFNTDLKI